MVRYITVLSVLLVALNPAAAIVPARTDRADPRNVAKSQPAPPTDAPARVFRMQAGAAILLDGRPCPWERVPADAAIVHMEVAEGSGLVVRIHFRSARSGAAPKSK
jgi:hypothetical protein